MFVSVIFIVAGGLALLIITLSFFGAVQSGVSCGYMDVAPNFSSEMNTVASTFGAIAGIMGPICVSLLIVEFEGALGWQIAFYITAVLAAVALILWGLFFVDVIVPELNTPLDSAEPSVVSKKAKGEASTVAITASSVNTDEENRSLRNSA